jgi:hypothetical protein
MQTQARHLSISMTPRSGDDVDLLHAELMILGREYALLIAPDVRDGVCVLCR